jgi:arylsulfatase A-like enzyme
MTGTYPHTHHVEQADQELASGSPTLAWALRQAGYRTAAFSANSYFSRSTGLGQGFIHFGDFFLSATDALAQVNYIWSLDRLLVHMKVSVNFIGRQHADRINRAALRWVGAGGQPFFLALNYMDGHAPYVPPQPWRHRFSTRPDPGGRINDVQGVVPNLSPAEIHDEMDAYDGAVTYEDDQLGRLLGELDRRGLLANTLVVVTSDHGEAFGEHALLSHDNALYFPLVHVPLVFSWPGHIPAGVRVARPVSTKDIAATILALVGQSPDRFPGESLGALWNRHNDSSSGWPLPLSELAEMEGFPAQFPDRYGPLETVVSPDAQYIIDPRAGPLLYDWRTDPQEVHNLIHDPRYQALAAELRDALKAEQQATGIGSVAQARSSAKPQ